MSTGNVLDQFELRWRSVSHVPPVGTCGAQFVAWDEDPAGEGVVIAIGANYGQTPTSEPHLPTKGKLGSLLSNYRHAAEQVASETWRPQWTERQWLQGSSPVPRPALFIMTNAVPWITGVAWTSLAFTETSSLVAASLSLFSGGFLQELHSLYPDAFAVGHGIDIRTLPHVSDAAKLWPHHMLYANLSHHKTPSRWDSQLARFRF